MSNTLKDAATSTIDTVSHLVEDAQGHLQHLPDHLPHLPMLHRSTPWWRSKWAFAGLTLALAWIGWSLWSTITRRRSNERAESGGQVSDAVARAGDTRLDHGAVRA